MLLIQVILQQRWFSMKKIRMSLGVQISILALSSSIVMGLILFIFIKEEFCAREIARL